MYAAFRDNQQSLPGDEEILKNQKPSIKVYLYPFKSTQPNECLPKLDSPQLILQPIINVEALKKYLSTKFKDVKPADIIILFKNQQMPDHYKLSDIDKIYHFPQDKTVFHFMKKIVSDNGENNI
jgi:hypothetical protein